nr:LOW QUALITY PROTEIN: zinc finger protein 449 [Neomonachus schauinslandi]
MAVALGCAIQASLNQGSVFQDYDADCEVFRQRFRQFQYEEAAGPHEAFNKLWELCCQWLKPKLRSKEQILELLVLEQFLTILPAEIETWVREHCPENRERVVSLIEDLQRELDIPEQQIDRQEMLLEELVPVGPAHVPPNVHLESPPLQVMGPAPDAPVAEAWMPQAGLPELGYGAAEDCRPFLDPVNQFVQDVKAEKKLEGMYPFSVSLDGNVLLGPNVPKFSERLTNPLGNPAEQLPRDCTMPVHRQNLSLRETAESSKQERPLSPTAQEQNSPRGKPPQRMQCGKCVAKEKLLNKHLQIPWGELPHKCLECGKRVLRKADLFRHHQVHTGETPYECSVCNKPSTQGSQLIAHQRAYPQRETNQRLDYKKRFCDRSSFMRHQKIHAGGKPHKYPSSGESFSRQRGLTLHQKTHTEERPFICEYCGESYRQRSSLVNHFKKNTERRVPASVVMVLEARKASRSYDAPSRSLERRILRQKVEGNSSYTPSVKAHS